MSSLALDVGGSFIKLARIEGGRVIDPVIRRPIPEFIADGFEQGARELSPAQLDAAVFGVLADLGIDDFAEHDVFISGQMAGLAFVDEQGQTTENIITWQDTRYVEVKALTTAIGHEALDDLGDGLRVGSPAVTLASRGVPDGASPTSLIAYVAGRVAGCRAERIHATDAGSWGLFDTRRMRWSSAACTAIGISEQSLPDVARGVQPVAPGLRTFTGLGDQQAALRGAGLKNNQVSVNLATGCQVSILSDDFTTTVQTRPYVDDRYLHTVTHLPAGRRLTAAVVEAFGDASETAWTQAAAECSQIEPLREAVDVIAQGVADAVDRLNAAGREVLFSGGLVQRFHPVREEILVRLGNPTFQVFVGEDAALAGLAAVGKQLH